MNKIGKVFNGLYSHVVTAVFFMAGFYVLFLNLFTTAYTSGDTFELNYYLSDPIILNILGIVLFFAGGVLLINKTRLSEKLEGISYEKFKKIVLIIIFVLGSLMVLSSHITPKYDQLYIQKAVYYSVWGDFGQFKPSEYMELFPHQIGFYLYSVVISFLFGTYNYQAMGILNALYVALIYNEISKITSIMGIGKKTRIAILLSGLIFTPLIGYSVFLYGTLIGMFFAIASIRLFMEYFNGKPYIRKIVLGIISITISLLLKKNSLIILIALVIYFIVKILTMEKINPILFFGIIFLGLSYVMVSVAPVALMRKVSGEKLDGGVSSWAFIAMGMQENSQNYAGGFNSYTEDSYRQNDCDTDKQAEVAKADIKNSINQFLDNPSYFLNFYTRKNIHQWSDPVYKSYYIVQGMERVGDISPLSFSLMKPQMQFFATRVLDIFQILIYIGALGFVINFRKDKKYSDFLLFPMIFVGGFLFHLLWEGKSEYSLLYFVMLMPIGIIGLMDLLKRLSKLDFKNIGGKLKELNNVKLSFNSTMLLVLSGLVVTFIGILSLGTLREQFKSDKTIYANYLKSDYKNTWGALSDGTYILKSDSGDYYLGGDNTKLEIVTNNGFSRIKKQGTDLYLSVHYMGYKHVNVDFEEYRPGETQEFRILAADNNKVYILYRFNYVLMLDDDINLKYQYGASNIIFREPEPNELWVVVEE